MVLATAFANGKPSPKNSTPKITSPKAALGFNLGDDYRVANYTQLEAYWKKLASESDRMKLVDIGPTAEGRRQYMAIITSPANLKNLAHYKEISRKLSLAQGISDEQARQLAHEGKAVVWMDGGLHASETVGSQQIMETVYELLSRTDPETMRFLNDDIALCVLANPDGQELVANWYMREPDETKRKLEGVPRLWQKYIGHDNNRDFFMSNMPETININRQLSREWFPQIMYNHHQTGPVGTIIFMPPFRDPFNFNFDPLMPLSIESVGTAMHSRLVAEGKGGSVMRQGANYSTWWNGGLRTICYFHNQIGLLTEIIGDPTPMDVQLVADKQLPSGDWPMPIAPQKWHYRQSIDYEITNNRAILDYASRNRETLLYNIYRMGANSIARGSKDSWTITPKRIEALKAAAAPKASASGRTAAEDLPAGLTVGGLGARTVPADLYEKVLHDPKHRDARGYVIPSDQSDFPTATKFVNTLIKNGVTVHQASADFAVNGKSYPAGSYVVKTAQAFRPHVLDMFEPQDHPNDFLYPGGPPVPPYDITGYTLAFQMGVKFDRFVDDFSGPFTVLTDVQAPPASLIRGPAKPAGYLISHAMNDSFTLVNRLLKANCDVYWLDREVTAENRALGTGTIWVPANIAALPILEKGAKELGVAIHAVAASPGGNAMKLKPVRIGLYDQYGGLMPSGWTRWLFEQYEFPFEVVYPQTLDKGNLKDKFDVLVFTDGAARFGETQGRGSGSAGRQPKPESIPEQFRPWLGRITEDKTLPQLKAFAEGGGSLVTIGSSTSMAELLGAPVKNYLTDIGRDGKEHPLSREKFYIPGSLLKVNVDNTNPLAYGMPKQVDVVFDNSSVFKLAPDAAQKQTSSVAWFSGSTVLDSGWAWGQQYLNGGTTIAISTLGKGKLMLLGSEVAFRGQPHATFKLLFNGVYYGSAVPATLQ